MRKSRPPSEQQISFEPIVPSLIDTRTVPEITPPLPERFEPPEHQQHELLQQSLALFSKQNSRSAFAKHLHKEIHSLRRQGYPEYSPELEKAQMGQYTVFERAARFGREAQENFAKAIGIATENKDISDKKGVMHTLVVAIDPLENIELQKRYRVFRNLYSPARNKRRQNVQKGKAPIIIPVYSNMDRLIDKEMYLEKRAENQAKSQPQLYEVIRAETFYESEPGEQVLAVNLLDHNRLMIEVITAFGVRRARMAQSRKFDRELKSRVLPDTSKLHLPERLDGESVGAYCNRAELGPNRIAEFARRTTARALGYAMLFSVEKDGSDLNLDRQKLASEFRKEYRAVWSSYSGADEATAYAREDDKQLYQTELRRLRVIARQSQRAFRKPVKQRVGQMPLANE